MRKLFSLMMVALFSLGMWADVGDLYYTFVPQKPSSGAVSDYTKTGSQTVDGLTWEVPGNWYATGGLRIGGKSISNVDRTITGKSAMGDAISQIVITHAGVTSDNLKLNSVTVTVASDASFTTGVETKKLTSGTDFTYAKNTSGTITFTPAKGFWAKDAYYKFDFNVSNANSSNYAFVLNKIEFYSYDAPAAPTTKTMYLTLSSDWAEWPAKYAIYYFKSADNTDNGWSEFMTAVDGETNMYTTTIPTDYDKLIFVRLDGSATTANWESKWSQTADLDAPKDDKNHFTVTSSGTGDGATGVWAKYPAVKTYYVKGSMTNNWSDAIALEDGSYTFVNLAAGKYELKVTDNADEWYGISNLDADNSSKYIYGSDNIEFELAEAGNVTVAFDADTKKITLTGSFVPRTTTFSVIVPEGTDSVFVCGSWDGWSTFHKMAASGKDNHYTLTIEGQYEDLQYKYLAGPLWPYAEVRDENRTWAEIDEVSAWNEIPDGQLLRKFPKGETSFIGYLWGTDVDKNKVIYDQNKNIMMFSQGNNLVISSNGLQIGNSSKPSAFVFRVGEESDVTVDLKYYTSDVTVSLYYMGETADVLTSSNLATEGTLCAQVGLDATNSEAALVKKQAAAGYYKVYSTLRFFVPKITVTEPVPAFYVTGDSALVVDAGLTVDAKWNPEAIKSMETSYKLTLKANVDYKLKVTVDGTWNDGMVKGFSDLTTTAAGLTTDDDNNICFKLNTAGEVNVHYDGEFFFLNGDFYVAPAPEKKYYMKNNWDGAADWTWKEMTKEDGYYALENVVFGGQGVNINTSENDEGATYIEAKDIVAYDAGYNEATLGALDTVAFYFDPEAVNTYTGENGLSALIISKYVAPAPVLPKVGLGANFSKWDWEAKLFEPAEDEKTASITVHLGVTDTIEFKVVSDGKWLSLNGEGESLYRFHRGWTKAEHINLVNDGRNFSLVTDAEGDYTFTWTYADSTLAITFPALPKVAIKLVPGAWNTGEAKFAAVTWKQDETMFADGVITDWFVGTDTVVGMIPADADSIAFASFVGLETPTLDMSKIVAHTDMLLIDKASMLYTITTKAEESWLGYWGDKPAEPEWYLVGDMTDWESGKISFKNGDIKTNLTVINKDYGFKVVKIEGEYKTWYGNTGTMTRENCTNWKFETTIVDNCKLTTDVAGEYTFALTLDKDGDPVVSVTFPEKPVTPAEHVYSLVGPILPNQWDEKDPATEMTLVEGVYTYTLTNVELPKGVYEYKIVEDHSWAVSFPQKGNASFTIEKSGIYDVTFTLDATTKDYAATPVLKEEVVVLPTVQIAGDWTYDSMEDKWIPVDMTVDESKQFASIKVNFEAGNHPFKMVIAGNWLGNGYEINRGFVGFAGLKENTADMTLVADVAGEYTFTWTFANDSIGVEFPAQETKYYMKNNWDGAADWTWKEMTKMDGYYALENVVFGGQGVNINTAASDEGASYIEAKDIVAFDADYNEATLGALDTVAFYFDPELVNQYTGDNGLTAFIINKYVAPVSQYGLLVNGEFVPATKNDAHVGEGEEWIVNITLMKNDQFQIYDNTYKVGWLIDLDQYGYTDFIIDTENAKYIVKNNGNYSFYINLNYGNDKLYVEYSYATGITDVDAEVNAVKVIRDGQIFILRGEHIYNAQGKLVK